MPLGLKIEEPANSVAPYFVEEVRRQLEKEYGVEEVHGAGLKVYTTLDLDLQTVANKAVLDGVATYERRHGWKGHLQNVADTAGWAERVPASGLDAGGGSGSVSPCAGAGCFEDGRRGAGGSADGGPAAWRTSRGRSSRGRMRSLKVGDVVYVRVEGSRPDGSLHLTLQEDSGAQASLMAVNNADGEVLAMVGGRDFALSQFNRATQSQRQVGSSFKPYVYTTAIEDGAKPTDIVVDGPTSFPTPNGRYTPHNYEGDYKGAMTLLSAFAESRNIPALKLAEKAGIKKVIETAHRFGITSNIPAFLPVAIGAADITLAEQVGAYSRVSERRACGLSRTTFAR